MGRDPDAKLGLGFCQNRFEGTVACRRFKEGRPTDQTVQGVTGKFSAARRGRSGMGGCGVGKVVSRKDSRPYLVQNCDEKVPVFSLPLL